MTARYSIASASAAPSTLPPLENREAARSSHGLGDHLLTAHDIRTDPKMLRGFQSVMRRYSRGGQPPMEAEKFLEICEEYGLDPSLALAQAIQESNIGTSGGRPTRTRNMYNVGNVDSGANRYMSSWEDGMRTYCRLMTRSYASTAEGFIGNNCCRLDGGGRYATDPNYAVRVGSLVRSIRNAVADGWEYAGSGMAGVARAYGLPRMPGADIFEGLLAFVAAEEMQKKTREDALKAEAARRNKPSELGVPPIQPIFETADK